MAKIEPLPKKITEARLQYEIVMWAQENGYYCFHCPNGEKRDAKTGAKLMAMGVRAGVTDLIFILDYGQTLWVELKIRGGKISTPQEKFKTVLTHRGHNYLLIEADSLEEAVYYLEPELARISHPELL